MAAYGPHGSSVVCFIAKDSPPINNLAPFVSLTKFMKERIHSNMPALRYATQIFANFVLYSILGL